MLFSLVALDVARHLAVSAAVIDLAAAGWAVQRENWVLDVHLLLVPRTIFVSVLAVPGLAFVACLLDTVFGHSTKLFAISIVKIVRKGCGFELTSPTPRIRNGAQHGQQASETRWRRACPVGRA